MAKKNSSLSASSNAVDPSLAALFAGSAGPVKPSPKSRYADLLPSKSDDEESSDYDDSSDQGEAEEQEGSESEAHRTETDSSEDEELSDATSAGESASEDDEEAAAKVLEAVVTNGVATSRTDKKRKRKRRDEFDDLESRHLQKLTKSHEEPSQKRRKGEDGSEKRTGGEALEDGQAPPKHESLTADAAAQQLEQASRTAFLSNVSVDAITSRKAKKALEAHLASVLDKTASPPQKIESIRFRSTPFASAAIPKRAAYIKKSVMESTTKSTNAYVVYSTAAAVRTAVKQLNGTIVLDRHLHVDSVAHPSPVDHRRCVFVGNLGFVDDETVAAVKIDEEGKKVTETRKRTKVPADVEEGLWRVFGKEAGKVESVRVVRDPITRVGKGFAYVQFYDENAVEAALLLAGKKFPPMLPRELRVTRCKALHKTARAMEAKSPSARDDVAKRGKAVRRLSAGDYVPKASAEAQTLAGRAAKLLGKGGAAKAVGRNGKSEKDRERRRRHRTSSGPGQDKGGKAGDSNFVTKSPEDIIFEGRRASARDGKPRDLKFKGAKGAKKKKLAKEGRGAVRAAKWRAAGNKK
ncbi:hypothetical protein VTK73DRAFT_2672 [Phialemonium thermophilum]|uniref:Nucleolar protein 12 n=1 Tax=Phialemonium thermophilum TaxID=223376 RepID=A0ABR3X3M5_9PEZI